MRLPAGFFLVSNCYHPIGSNAVTPVFAERIAPLDDRDEQWQRIKDAGADSRTCEVHKDPESYKLQQQTATQDSNGYPSVVLIEIDEPRRQ
jgi:hypothetical protein